MKTERSEGMDDNEIVALFWQRDEKALKYTSEKYEKYCEKIALNILGDKSDAEECVNDTYLRLWNSIPPARPTSLLAFIGTVARNISLDAYRKKRSDKRLVSEYCISLEELRGTLGEASEPVETNASQAGELINAFLAQEKERDRRVFVCRYYYFDSIEDISKHHGMTESKVKSILFRMRKRLKKYIESEGYEI